MKLRQIAAFFLSVVMVTTMLPPGALAAEEAPSNGEEVTQTDVFPERQENPDNPDIQENQVDMLDSEAPIAELVASYDMSQSAGKLTDTTGNGFDAVCTGFTDDDFNTEGTDAVLTFDGSVGKYVSLPAGMIEAEAFAIEATFKTSTANNSWLWALGTKEDKWPNVKNYVFLAPKHGDSSGAILAGIKDASSEKRFSDAGSVGDDYATVRVEFDHGDMTILVDGVQTATLETWYSIQEILKNGTTGEFCGYIGKSLFTPDPPFKGVLTQFNVYAAKNTESVKLELDREALTIHNSDAVKGDITLPVEGENGSAIAWTCADGTADGVITLTEQNGKAPGLVTRGAEDKTVNLTATLTLGGKELTKEVPLTVKAMPVNLDTDYTAGYLWSYFQQTDYEKIYFGYSEDGVTWSKLNEGQPLLSNTQGTKGVRDPHILRSVDGDKYWMLGTDLHAEGTAGGGSWDQYGASQNLVVWESDDLVNWSDSELVFSGFENAGCVWAPEAIYDEAEGDYLVYWSARDRTQKDTDDWALRVYVCRTRDFHTFSEPTVWLTEDDPSGGETNIIDTSILKVGEYYYRFSTSDWLTVIDRSKTLSTSTFDVMDGTGKSKDGAWERMMERGAHEAAGLDRMEGLTGYLLPDGDVAIMGDNSAYRGFSISPDALANFESGTTKFTKFGGSFVNGNFRHGTVMRLSAAEEAAILDAYGPARRPDSDADGLFYSEDFSGSHPDLTLNGSARVVDGKLVLDGASGGYANLPAGWMDGLDAATISFDVTTQKSDGAFFTFAIGQDKNTYMFFRAKGTAFNTAITTGSYGAESTVSATGFSGVETNVTLVFDGNKMYTYINGLLAGKNGNSATKLTDLGVTAQILFGKSLYDEDGYFKGSFDNVKLYDRALSARQIANANGVKIEALVTGATIGTYPEAGTGLDEHTAVASWMDKSEDGKFTVTSYIKKYTFNEAANTQTLSDLTAVPVTFDSVLELTSITLDDGSTIQNGGTADFSEGDRVFTVANEADTQTITLQQPKLATNSLLPGQFADPDIDYFDGKYWIYPTTDGSSGWSGTQFHAFSADSLSGPWTDEGVILDVANKDPGKNIKDVEIASVAWSTGSAWAPSIEKKGDKYYFYFCAKKSDGKSCVGVAVADHPAGPYTAQEAPLLDGVFGVSVGQDIDPSIFTDTDGTAYMYWGNGSAAVVQLNDDMVSIKAGTAKNLSGLTAFRESVVVVKVGDTYHFTWSCDDTGSEDYRVNYGTSKSPYGPVTYHYNLLQKNNALNMKGTAHQSMVEVDGRYYMAYHRFYTPLGLYTSGLGYHRETCVNEVPYDEKTGLFLAIQPTMEGTDGDIILANGDKYYSDKAQQDYDELTIANADDVRGNISLPSQGKNGTAITWTSPDGSADGVISLAAQGGKSAGVVTRGSADKTVRLTATVGEKGTKDFTLTVKAAPVDLDTDYTGGYLFAYFRSEDYDNDGVYQEEIYFGNSEDGLHWSNLNEKKGVLLPVLKSELGTKGVRDPHLIRSAEGDRYWIIATDLRIEASSPTPSWGDVQQNGSTSLVVWESEDLVSWSEPELVKVNFDTAGCTWAPEAIYDEQSGEYLVYWASPGLPLDKEGSRGHRIWSARTRDFHSFSEPQVFIDYVDTVDPGYNEQHQTIDTSIVFDNGKYYRISKYEGAWKLFLDSADDLNGTWTRVANLPDNMTGEGATFYKLPDGTWCIMIDSGNYYAVTTPSLDTPKFTRLTQGSGAGQYTFPNGFRHGTVVRLSATEYSAVTQAYANVAVTRPEADASGLFYSENFETTPADDLTLNGSAKVEDGKLVLDGNSGGYAALPTGWMNGLDAATISFDLVTQKASGNFFTFAIGQDSDQYMFLRTREKDFGTAITTGSYGAESTMNVHFDSSVVGQSKHVVLVFDGKKMATYIDGILAAQNETSATSLSDLGENAKIWFGRSFYSADGYFQGSFDNIKLYDRALTADQVAGMTARNAVNALPEIENADKIVADFTLPGIEGITVSWSADNAAITIKDGAAEVGKVQEDTTVTLTASVTLDGETAERVYTVTVIALPGKLLSDSLDIPYYISQSMLPRMILNAGITWNWSALTMPASGLGEEQTLTATFALAAGQSATKAFSVRPYADAGTLVPYIIANGEAVNGQAEAMTMAVVESGTVSLLNKGEPVVYTKSFQQAANSRGLQWPTVFRKPDGSFDMVAVSLANKGNILVYDSADLTAFTGERLVKVSDGALDRMELLTTADGYRLYWQEGSKTYTAASTDLTGFTAPEEALHQFLVTADILPGVATQTNLLGLTAGELAKVHARFDAIVNTTVDHQGDVSLSAGSALPTLPDRVTAHYSDGSVKELGVTYDTSAVDTSKAGTYTVTGAVQQPVYDDPLIEERADPYVVYNEADGYYYFTASYPQSGGNGEGYDRLVLRRAATIEGLRDAPETTVWSVEGDYQKFIWAPEMHKIGDTWYIITTARRMGADGNFSISPVMVKCTNADDMLNAESWEMAGRVQAMDGAQQKVFTGMSLDMTYFAANGKDYLVWADCSTTASSLFIATIDPADPLKLTSEAVMITTPEYTWEMRNNIVNEGASVIERDGNIYLAFSASGTGSEYAVGILTADSSADLLDVGSWTKSDLPIMTTADFPDGLSGPGHNSFTVDEYGNPVIVYHARPVEHSSHSGDPLYDTCRHARVKTVHFAADGRLVLNMTPEEELNPANKTFTFTVTITGGDSGSSSSGSPSGNKTETVQNPDGSTTKTVTDPKTGAVTETTTYPDGTRIVATTPKDGETSIDVTVPSGKKEVTVTLPTAEKPAPGVVAAIVHEDGARETVKTSVATEDGLRISLTGSAKLVLVDNTKTFTDVGADHWAADAVQFAASRELFTGTGKDTFAPAANMTRGMLMTVLARLDGWDTTLGDSWYSAGMEWAKEQEISDGTAPEADVTRESLVVMLYRYAGSPEMDEERRVKDAAPYVEFADVDSVSDWSADAMAWAVLNGILQGTDGKLNPQGLATRAEVSAMLMRFLSK